MNNMFDLTRSLAAAKRIQVEKKECYKNSLLIFLNTEEFRDGWYVEGFAIPDIRGIRLPMEHGWIALPDGSIIDVSYADLGHTSVEYFPALQFTWNQAMGLVRKEALLPIMLWQRSIRHLHAYKRAQAAAYKTAFGAGVPE